MNNELKQKIQKSMMDFLVANGYPDKINNNQIIAHLPNLWKKLENEGLLTTLVSRGFNFQQFVNIALQSKAQAELHARMEDFFRSRR